METQKKIRAEPHIPLDIFTTVYNNYLSKKDIMVGRSVCAGMNSSISSYHFSSTLINTSSPKVLMFDENVFYLLDVDHPPTTRIIYPKSVIPPPSISRFIDAGETDVRFHGSTLGLICLTIENSGYLVWNPNTGRCREFSRLPGSVFDDNRSYVRWNPNLGKAHKMLDYAASGLETMTNVLMSGMGHVGGGNIQIVCVGTKLGTVPDSGVPMSIHILPVKTGGEWSRLDIEAVFLAPHPCYVGVANDLMLWSYPDLNPTYLCGFDFHTQTVVNLTTPPPGPLPPLKPTPIELLNLFVANYHLWALGENLEAQKHFLSRFDGVDWEIVTQLFNIQVTAGMIEGLVGASSDFSKILIFSTFHKLLLLHIGGEDEDSDLHSTTLVDVRYVRDDDEVQDDSADSVTDTHTFENPRSIQFEETLFFPVMS